MTERWSVMDELEIGKRNRMWWPCYSGDLTDEDARILAAEVHGVAPDQIEVVRRNIVLCRVKEQAA